jgi:saccharopine dehydrogenase (NADP+, L-glutamate forming)/spermidine synthase
METERHRRVLILGAGLVSRPIVRHFLEDDGYRLTVASLDVEDAQALLNDHPRGTAREVDVADPAQLEPLIADSDLVVSLVPYAFHVQVAKCAIRHRAHMVTASYVFPEMRALDAQARAAGVAILNEVGLDPGIDHMSAMRLIDGARDDGASVAEFVSCCGGLPSPEAADNPWKYKFSWSPRGALLAARLSARHLENGRVVSIPGESLFDHVQPYDIEGVGRFEIYPNRDSLRYAEAYGLHEVRTMLRATVRYPGWAETLKALVGLRLLDVDERDWPAGTTYAGFLETYLPDGPEPLRTRLARAIGLDEEHPVVARLDWAGLLADEPLTHEFGSPLDVLADRFQQRMCYADGERDMVVLRHELLVQRDDGHDERRISLLVSYGEAAGDSATSRTVSLPAAVAGELLLEGRVRPGVHIPTEREIYEPILARLEAMGISFREWSDPLPD